MKKLIILALVAAALAGCQSQQEATQELIYTYDERTDMCFAVKEQSYGDSIANVECTPQAMMLAGRAHFGTTNTTSIPTTGPAVWQLPNSRICVTETIGEDGVRHITPADCPQ